MPRRPQVTYQPRCLRDGRDELCYRGPSYWMARATLKTIVAHQPAFDVRARLYLSSGADDRLGVATLFLATPAGVKPIDVAPLGRALYAAQGPGVDDVFVTAADGGNPRFLHNACPSGGADSSCCVGVIPAAARARLPPAVRAARLPGEGEPPRGEQELPRLHGEGLRGGLWLYRERRRADAVHRRGKRAARGDGVR